MQRRTGQKPLWEIQVNETIQLIRQRSKSRSLKSSSVYECICIFIASYLKKRQLAYQTVRNHYRHLDLFHRWLEGHQPGTPIGEIDSSCIQCYFVYLNDIRHYKKFSLQIVQVVLKRFFHSMRLRRLIDANPVDMFNIQAKHTDRIQRLPSPFELMQLLRSVNEHYQYLVESKKAHKFSLFIHRRDLCILALCVCCGLRRSELQRIQIDDVDFEAKTILIDGKGSGRFTIRQRLIFFSHPFLEEILSRFRVMRSRLPGSSFFSNWLGDELAAKSIDCIFKTYNFFLHSEMKYNPTVLRKSFCTHLVEKKVNLTAIQRLLGHEQCETTLKYYVQLSAQQLEKTFKETAPYGT